MGVDAGRRSFVSGLLALPLASCLPRDGRAAVRLRHGERHQVIEGFGTCLNDWQADVTAAYLRDVQVRYYLDDLGASVLRIPLSPWIGLDATESWQDIDWRNFRFDAANGRPKVAVDLVGKLAAASKGQVRFIATAWTPPPWMKVNGLIGNGHPQRQNFSLDIEHPATLDGSGSDGELYVARNSLRKDRYPHFAKWLVEWVRYYRSIGIELYALSPTNEPRFSHWFESCTYTPADYAELVDTIAAMFVSEGEKPVPLFGPELMTWDSDGNSRYLEALARRKPALDAMGAIASHGYVDGYVSDMRNESTLAFRKIAAPHGKRIWLTEGGYGGHDWPKPLFQLANSFLVALRDGGVSLLTPWQTLSPTPDEDGLMSLQGPTKKTYAAMQFWRFIRPGMVRIAVDGAGKLDVVAFEDAQAGKTVVVCLNKSKLEIRASLAAPDRRIDAIDATFVTDGTRNCERVVQAMPIEALAVPPEAILTLVLKTRPLAV